MSENDQLFGDDGDDAVYQLAAADQTLNATKLLGQGTDSFFSVETATLMADDLGRQLIVDGFGGPVTLIGGAGDDKLTGGIGPDVLEGRGGDDTLDGRDGDDTYRFVSDGSISFGTDTIDETGGDKSDTLDLGDVEVASSTIDLSSSSTVVTSLGNVVSTVFAALENVIGTTGDDVITGNAEANVLDGGDGKDTIDGREGDDTIVGGMGDDSLATSADADTFVFTDTDSSESDALALGGESFTLDFATLSAGQNLRVDLASGLIASHTGRQVVLTSSASSGDLDDVTVLGSLGDDLFIDTTRDQTYIGGPGNDTYRFEGSSTHVDEIVEAIAGGIDTIDLSDFSSGRLVDLRDSATNVFVESIGGADRVRGVGAAYFENIVGGSGNDTLRGNVADNQINGGPGNDVLDGFSGNDTYRFDPVTGAAESDAVVESSGNGRDTIDFSRLAQSVTVHLGNQTASHFGRAVTVEGVENAIGGSAADSLTGNSLDNELRGGDGNDVIRGGFGNDLTDGGDGDDRYEFAPLLTVPTGPGTSVAIPEVDRIADSGGDGDRIDFSALSPVDAVSLVIDLSSPILARHSTLAVGGSRQVIAAGENVFLEQARGSEGADTIIGNDLPNELFGDDGNDTLFGRRGNDLIDGESGDDVSYGEWGDDRLRAYDGTNTLVGGSGNDLYSMDPLFGNVNAVNTLVETSGSVTGGFLAAGGRDTLLLPDVVDAFDLSQFTAAGSPLTYGSGPNTLTIDLQNVASVRDGSQFENLISDNAAASLTGNAGNNLIYGGSTIVGGDGQNILIGAAGLDSITGGANDDLLLGGDVDFGGGSFDIDQQAFVVPLLEIQREWNRGIPLTDRIDTLSGLTPSSLPQVLVTGVTVVNDGLDDVIVTGAGDNWIVPETTSGSIPAESFGTTSGGDVLSREVDSTLRSDSPPNRTIAPPVDSALSAVSVDPAAAIDLTLVSSLTQPGESLSNAAAAPADAQLRVRVVPVATPSDPASTTPPSPITTLNQGETFVSEIWVQSTQIGAPGLTGMFLDLIFDGLAIQASTPDIDVNSEFELLQDGSALAGRGLLDDVGGATLQSDVAANQGWIRLASVNMNARRSGMQSLTPLPGKVRPAQVGVGNVEWDQVELNAAELYVIGIASVTQRRLYYPGTVFGDAADTSKLPLLPGATPTFANYTGVADGITGVQIDVRDMDGAAATIDDFLFRTGNSTDPSAWVDASPPDQFEFLPGGGADGTDRVIMIWSAANSVKNAWLQVTMLATPTTNLPAPDVHYWGNQIGETGNLPGSTAVNALDAGEIVNNQTAFVPAGITNPFDLDRNNAVNSLDTGIAVNNTTAFTSLLLFIPPSNSASQSASVGFSSVSRSPSKAEGEFTEMSIVDYQLAVDRVFEGIASTIE